MARSWSELLGDEQGGDDSPEERRRFFRRLRNSLGRTRSVVRLPLGRFDPRDDESWEALEEALISADVGMAATEELVERLRKRRDVDDLERALVEQIAALVGEPGTLAVDGRPSVVLVVGVNGTGQNGLQQARMFGEAVDVSGVALTKLDGSAKGGIVVAIQRELGIPVKLVGVGEGPDDLIPFEPAEFVDALFG